MPRPTLIEVGQRYGRLVVTGEGPRSRDGRRRWRCSCDCGGEALTYQKCLRSGQTQSCGCLMRERTSAANTTHGGGSVKNGRSPEYVVWCAMKARCYNPRTERYPEYGGRNIQVCARWRDDFPAFLADMGPRPSREYSIERKDVNGNYEPGNCVWLLKSQQSANRRGNVMITHGGETLTAAEWGRRLGVNGRVIRKRLAKGWDTLRALFGAKAA